MALEGPQIATIVTSVVALVVSSTALLWSTLQLFHSYLGSAKGYSRINEEAMPGWFNFKRRVFHKAEFRFGVKYDTPVFIVCPVSNVKFPMSKQTWLFIGDDRGPQSPPSSQSTQIQIQKEGKKSGEGFTKAVNLTKKGMKVDLIPQKPQGQNGGELQGQKSVHTVNNERATWIELLSALDTMERESQEWETAQPRNNKPPCPQPPLFEERTLAVAIQRKTRSWDNMPSSITKPYATTTICHIMEMAAMLGLHWKEFDRGNERFLAEGNGFVLKSTSVSELGTVFTFQVRGASQFTSNRTIPDHQVKDLAFGLVPTIYHERHGVDESRLTALSADEFKNLKYLQMGSANELAETLTSLGCNTRVSELIRQNNTNQRHLYPLAFEVVGMLGRVLHIEKSFFRIIPNPTFYQWDVRYFSLPKALSAFKDKISGTEFSELDRMEGPFDKLRKKAQGVGTALAAEHQNYAGYLGALRKAIHLCDGYLGDAQSDTKGVLSKHVEVVLSCLNPRQQQTDDMNMPDPAENADEDSITVTAFLMLNSAPESEKEKQLIDIYFDKVRLKVCGDHKLPVNERKTIIWCTLVLRSLCWLALHDFHKNDRQPKGKSELMGSRLPVYII